MPNLILVRDVGQRILIDDNIILTIIEVKGTKVRLGIQAPAEVKIDREEVRKQKETAK